MPIKPLRKAVFPVAGLGTRFLPATKAMPKEMLTVVDKPLIQYAVEEALGSGDRADHLRHRARQGRARRSFRCLLRTRSDNARAGQVDGADRRYPPEARFAGLRSPAGAARARPCRVVRARNRRGRAIRGAAARRIDGRHTGFSQADGRCLSQGRRQSDRRAGGRSGRDRQIWHHHAGQGRWGVGRG